MDVETWKTIWKLVFIASSVHLRRGHRGHQGFGDVAQMLRNMAAGRGANGQRLIPTNCNIQLERDRC